MRPHRPLSFAAQPKSKVVKMRYCEQIGINPGIGAPSGYTFRANDIFDPNYTSTGHQPMGHDQWSAFYNHYTVLGSKLTVTMSNQDAADAVIAGVYLVDDTTAPTTVTTLIENAKGPYGHMDSSGGSGIRRLTCKYSAKKFFRCDVRDRTDLKASFGSSPTEQAYYTIWAAAMDTLADPGNVVMTVVIDYICLLTEPKDLSAS